MKLLSGCGASTRGAGVGAALVESAKRFHFDIFIGVSYSAVVGVPLALGMYEEILQESSTLTHNKFFDVSPMTKKGVLSFKGVMRLLGSISKPKKIHSFGVQNVTKILEKFVTKEIFQTYKEGNFADVYVCAVCVETQLPVIWNVKHLTYENYLKVVSASSRIPVWTQMEEIEGLHYYDGGVTDTNASILLLEKLPIKEVVSIYPRPEDFAEKPVPEVCGIVGAINWTIDTMLKNISFNDAIVEKLYCEQHGIELKQIFLPYVLKNLYDVNPERLKKLQYIASNETIKSFEV
jgi:hypothetical protein